VLGHRQAVDVVEGAHAQRQQAGLGRPHQSQVGAAPHEVQGADQDRGERAGREHEAGAEPGVVQHPPVEDLLDQDGDRQLAGRGDHRHDQGQGDALAQLGGDFQAPAQHLHGPGVAELLLVGGDGGGRLAVERPRRGLVGQQRGRQVAGLPGIGAPGRDLVARGHWCTLRAHQ
jgi:hypothetical protein